MHRLKPLLTILLLYFCFPYAAGEVVWLEKDYDFGLMKEEAGPKTGSVRFVNTGPEEVVITGARPSCGCTGVAYPEDPIAPGDTVNFSFTYNPLGRPGKFEKTIRVYIGDYDMATIRIRGNVLGTPESLTSLYPIEAGSLRLSANRLPAGDVTYGATRHFFINGYNQTPDTIYPTWELDDPALSVSSSAEAVGPGDIVTFSFYLNSREKNEMGAVEIPVRIISDKTAGSDITDVLLSANITPDFSRLSPEEVADGPRCYVSPDRVDLGVVNTSRDNSCKFKFYLRNEGKSPMRVLRIFSNDKKVKLSRWPASLKPGKSGVAEGSLNISGLTDGPFNIKIEVMTDDPLHPVRTVSLVGIKE